MSPQKNVLMIRYLRHGQFFRLNLQLLLLAAMAVMMSTASSAASFDGPAELPRISINTAIAATPAPGKLLTVNAGQSFQNALSNANCGDTIQLQAGATFSGSFVLPAKTCDNQHWIIIRTSAANALPPEGTRVTPCYAGVASLPGRPAYACSTPKSVLAKLVFSGRGFAGPIAFAPGANHYRLLGLEVTHVNGNDLMYLAAVQSAGTANNIIIDRCWFHGTTTDDTASGFHMSGVTYGSVVDSYFSDFHCTAIIGLCTDAHAVSAGSGDNPSGPYAVVNNFLEASGENVEFGGARATITPADISIRHNHLFKPMLWMPGAAGFIGGKSGHPFVVKNHFELKNAERVLFEGNILENVWGGFTQSGFSVLLTPKNPSSGGTNGCPTCQVDDVTIRYSTISHAGGGIAIATALSDTGGMALYGERFSIHDVTVDDLNAKKYKGTGAFAMVGNSWSRNVLSNVVINHVTGFTDPASHVLGISDRLSNPLMGPFSLVNSIVVAGAYGIASTGGGPANCAYHNSPVLALSQCFTAYQFDHNAVISPPASVPASQWPVANHFPASITSVGFVKPMNGVNGNYQLLSSSPYKNAGTDGKDLGADISAINAATAGAY